MAVGRFIGEQAPTRERQAGVAGEERRGCVELYSGLVGPEQGQGDGSTVAGEVHQSWMGRTVGDAEIGANWAIYSHRREKMSS